jgi:hypothetical protein
MPCQPTGCAIGLRRDLDERKWVPTEAGTQEDWLYAARRSFATLLNDLQITDRATQSVMEWSNASQAARR